jgi:beta-glucuronidase
VRKIEVRGTRLLLNGEPIMLTGVNRHEEYAGTGRVDPGGLLEEDLELVKRLNGNTVRMHYQAHPRLYELADRMGLLVFAEIPVWQVGVRDPVELMDPGVRRTAEGMLRTLVGELKNHPSVVTWSVGNECATSRVEARPLIDHLARLARSLDGTRPVSYVSNLGPEDKCLDLVDLPCLNTYFGRRIGELGVTLDRVAAMHPARPILVAEFGSEAFPGMRGEGPGTEAEQAAVLRESWDAFRERRGFVMGALVWSLADYWHVPVGPEARTLNPIYFCHGLTTLSRKPKASFEVCREMFRGAAGA